MNSRMLMITSALVLAIIGLALSFAPEELLRWLGEATHGRLTVILQLAGALYLGFAIMNWTAKGSLLGGIYGRAIVLGNSLHFTMGALTLLKVSIGAVNGPMFWLITAIYVVFAIWFGRTLFTHPAQAG